MKFPPEKFEDMLKTGIAAGTFKDWMLGAVTDKASFMAACQAHRPEWNTTTLATYLKRKLGGKFDNWVAFCTVPTARELVRKSAREAVLLLVLCTERLFGRNLHECPCGEPFHGLLYCAVCYEAILLGVRCNPHVLHDHQVCG